MFDKDLIEKKIGLIIGYIEEMRPIVEVFSVSEVIADYFKYHTAERLLQLIVDTMTDINVHLIKEKTISVPDDLEDTFAVLAEHDLLPDKFALHIAPIVGLRNRIVHRYDTLNMKDFIEKLKRNFSDFDIYIGHIKKLIQKQN